MTLTAQLTGNAGETSESITSYEGSQLPAEAIGQLSESVDQLDAGMQGLNIAIGTFSSNLGDVKQICTGTVPGSSYGYS